MKQQEEVRTEYDSVEVKRCSCSHAFQDKRYGKGMRLHNKGTKKWVCTVCDKEYRA